jgi:hypothetical protein
MELQQFISGSIKQIIDGIIEAQEYAASKKTRVNPTSQINISNSKDITIDANTSEYVQLIDFDLAITTSESDKAKVGAGIYVVGIGLGSQLQADISSGSISRLKFTVPIIPPKQ